MTTYSSNYRKIYEEKFGPIPKDDQGRTYDIHHIDGNHDNNDPSNLKAVSIQEHYDIHYAQGDYFAANMIATRMKLTPEEISELCSSHMLKLTEEGKNPFSKRPDGTSVSFDMVKYGTHNFLTKADGTNIQTIKVKNKSHHLLKKDDGSSIGGDNIKRRVKNNEHHIKKEFVTCFDKNKNVIQLDKEQYYSQQGPKEDWEWVHNKSKEAKSRKGG